MTRHWLLLLTVGLLYACGDSESVFGTCEITDRDTDEVITVHEDMTLQTCKNLVLGSEANDTYTWDANDF